MSTRPALGTTRGDAGLQWWPHSAPRGEIDIGTEENKDVVRQYLAAMHASPPNLDVFDELLAPSYVGDRAGGKAFAAASTPR